MTLRRRLDWNSALRDLHADHAPVVPGLLAARALASSFSRSRKLPLVITTRTGRSADFAVSHAFDRAAIMTVATLTARAHQAKHGGTWAAAMAVGLKAAWQSAKLARAGVVH